MKRKLLILNAFVCSLAINPMLKASDSHMSQYNKETDERPVKKPSYPQTAREAYFILRSHADKLEENDKETTAAVKADLQKSGFTKDKFIQEGTMSQFLKSSPLESFCNIQTLHLISRLDKNYGKKNNDFYYAYNDQSELSDQSKPFLFKTNDRNYHTLYSFLRSILTEYDADENCSSNHKIIAQNIFALAATHTEPEKTSDMRSNYNRLYKSAPRLTENMENRLALQKITYVFSTSHFQEFCVSYFKVASKATIEKIVKEISEEAFKKHIRDIEEKEEIKQLKKDGVYISFLQYMASTKNIFYQ
jgi:hypothetical protein